MLLLLGKALLKGTVPTLEARVVSAVRFCTEVAFAVEGVIFFLKKALFNAPVAVAALLQT